jgi:hypothetical protein
MKLSGGPAGRLGRHYASSKMPPCNRSDSGRFIFVWERPAVQPAATLKTQEKVEI